MSQKRLARLYSAFTRLCDVRDELSDEIEGALHDINERGTEKSDELLKDVRKQLYGAIDCLNRLDNLERELRAELEALGAHTAQEFAA